MLYRDVDFREAVMALTAGKGVDVVYDAVGKDTIARSIRSVRRRGLCVNYGGASGLVKSIEPLELGEAGSIFFTRPHLADYTASAEEIAWRTGDLFAACADGGLTVGDRPGIPAGRCGRRAPAPGRRRHARQAAAAREPLTDIVACNASNAYNVAFGVGERPWPRSP